MKNYGLKKKAIASTLAIATLMSTTMSGLIVPVFATGDKIQINSVDLSTTEWTNENVTLTIDAEEIGDAEFVYESYSFDGGSTWQQNNSKEYDTNTSNIYVAVRGSNGVTNYYEQATNITNIDKVKPEVSGVTGNSDKWQKEIKLVVTGTDNASGIEEYSFDDGETWQKDNFKVYYENVDEIKIKVKDAAGNISDAYATQKIEKIDRTAPQILSITGNPTEYQRTDGIVLTIDAVDTQSGKKEKGKMQYSFDGGETWQTTETSSPITENGTVHIQVKDSVGNVVSQDVVIEKIDNVFVALTQESEVWNDEDNTSTVTVRASNKELAENEEWTHPYILDGQGQPTEDKDLYALSKVYEENGTYKNVEFTDCHGFTATTNIVVEEIDDVAPTVEIEHFENADGTVTVKITADEDLDVSVLDLLNANITEENAVDEFDFVDPADNTVIEGLLKRNVDLGEISFCDVWGNETLEEVKITGCKFVVLMEETDYPSTSGVALISANSVLGLKDIKPTWTYVDAYNMQKAYYKNGAYTTTFTNVYGETYQATFNVTRANFSATVMDVDYSDDFDNEVTVTVTSAHEFKATKPTWTLSSDRKSYTKKFKANADYLTTFEDVYGEKEEIRILVTQIDTQAPNITFNMESLPDGSVRVKAIANEECANTKPTWTLSSDKKTFEKIYSRNGTYTTTYTDKHGLQTTKTFKVTGCTFGLTQTHESVGTDKIKVTVYSPLGFRATKPTWTLSSDGKSYTKTFPSTQTTYSTTFVSSDGESVLYTINFDEPI